jgi:hypothetical protein
MKTSEPRLASTESRVADGASVAALVFDVDERLQKINIERMRHERLARFRAQSRCRIPRFMTESK